VGREGPNDRTIIEFDVADSDFVHESGRAAIFIETWNFHEVFAMGKDGAGVIVKLGELVAEPNVIESAWIIFGGEEIIALFEAKSFAHILESVGVGPADTDGLFREGKCLFALGVDGAFGLDPVDLVGHETFGEHGVGVDFDGGEDHHKIFDF